MKKIISIVSALFIFASSGNQAHAQSWKLTGNSGTNSATNFIGTTDAKNLKIRTNNYIRMNITSKGKIAIGNFSPVFKLDVRGGSINTDSMYRINGLPVLSINGIANNFVGVNSGFYNTTGSANTTNGYNALYTNTTGAGNTAAGYKSLYYNTIGENNTASGYQALYHNTVGNYNTATGSDVLPYNTTGSQNTGSGYRALYHNSSGIDNTATGHNALFSNTTGGANTANGLGALYSTTTGYYNTAGGNNALHYNTTGFSNTAIGVAALTSNITGNANTGIGTNCNTSIGALLNATVIGADATVNASHKVRIGSSSVAVIEGQVGYSHPSDARFKENVKADVKGLDFILKLQPVSYNFNRLKFAQHVREHLTSGREKALLGQSQNRSVGFIAQDVEKIIHQTGFTSFDAVHAPTNETDNYSMGYAEFVVPLVKAVQELSRELELVKSILATEQQSKRTLKTESAGSMEQNSPGATNTQAEIESLKIELTEIKSALGLRVDNVAEKISSVKNVSAITKIVPNPFSSETEIRLFISSASQNAVVQIVNESGKLVKEIMVPAKRNTSVKLDTTELTAGIYFCSLIVDGNKIATEKMTCAK